LQHKYRDQKRRIWWSCGSLEDAFRQYSWRNKNFERTQVELAGYQERLTLAVDPKNRNGQEAIAVAKEVQRWGGTNRGRSDRGNIAAIDCYDGQFVEYLRFCGEAFNRNDLIDELPKSSFKIRSNAGFTKIYSLFVDSFCIYDSRVAAALGMLAKRHCVVSGMSCIPQELQFAPMASAGLKERRDPSEGSFKFKSTGGKDAEHFKWNIRTNWILKAALADTKFGKIYPSAPLRALEAALFMIGYDIRAGE